MKKGELGKGAGNTKPLQNKKRQTQGKRWCFTWNNYDELDYQLMAEHLEHNKIPYIMGKEVGENGTPHIQGYLESEKLIRPIEYFGIKQIHWEKAKGTREQNIIYCSKENNAESNFKRFLMPRRLTAADVINEENMYAWQLKLLEQIEEEPDKRKIYWYWDPEGGAGKTEMAKYLYLMHGAVPMRGKCADILNVALIHDAPVYIFTFARSAGKIHYEAIEMLKDGFFMTGKYEGGIVARKTPHIICFANEEPDVTQLSEDRWVIERIKKEDLGVDPGLAPGL